MIQVYKIFIPFVGNFYIVGLKSPTEELGITINQSATSSPAMKEKKIRARPLGQQAVQEQDLKPEFRLKVNYIHGICVGM